MADPTLPAEHEIEQFVPRPGSVVYRRASDARHFLAPGYALLLQVAHPVVGTGVSQHSDFRSDPWTRLFHTLDFLNVVIYGGPEQAAQMGRAVRERHRSIKGDLPGGGRYFALDPEAYAWVHATLAQAIFVAAGRFGRPFAKAEREEFYGEWKGLGRLFGVRDQDLPPDVAGFDAYIEDTIQDRLEDTPAAQDVLDALIHAPTDPLPGIPRPAWMAMRRPSAHVLGLTTVGLLPPVLRGRLGLSWSRRQEFELRALGRASRSVSPLMPRSLRRVGPTYLRMREGKLYFPSAPAKDAAPVRAA